MNLFSVLLSAPIWANIMLGCFIAAAACMAVNYHRQIERMQEQNERLIAGMQKILALAENMSGQKQDAK